MNLEQFDFELPSSLIAQAPVEPKDQSRLLTITSQGFSNKIFKDLPELLDEGDVLVFNDTKVIPAALKGSKATGARITVNLLKPQAADTWQALAKPMRKLHIGDVIKFADNFQARVVDKPDGHCILQFDYPTDIFFKLLDQYGSMPLPPYIKRVADQQDRYDYQTLFASHPGAVAAPTAGLHFTPTLINSLKQKGIKHAFVTLHVGGGTFLPVKQADITKHKMHSEWYELTSDNYSIINQAISQGNKIVAVGTTSLRVLESIGSKHGKLIPEHGETDIFIYPGYKFKIVNYLVTNFHLPRSTLFMLVCAFGGYNQMLDAYKYAISQKYRFFSYGDACLIENR